MKTKHLNEHPELWLRKAKGFKWALELCLKEYKRFDQGTISLKEAMLLMEPMKHLAITSIELYLRSYLLTKGKSWEDTKKLMGNGKHDISKLLDVYLLFDSKFGDKELSYIRLIAGSTKNYGGTKYPESGASASFFYLTLLEKLDSIVSSAN